jgi:hypothetical protein
MASFIRFALSNYSLTFLVLALIAAAISLLGRRPVNGKAATEALLRYFVLFAIALMNFYNFVMHVFFGAMSARFIGWADSPFQAEVGFASLGFAAVGLLAFHGSRDMRLAAVLGPAFFLWGAAGGHLYQMITAHNFAPGNAGVVFYTDIGLPLLGFLLLWVRYRSTKQS